MIRLAGIDDFKEMQALYRHLVPPDGMSEDTAMLRDRWRQLVEREGVSVFVHARAARLVSTCTLIVVPNVMRAGRPYAYIENIVTHADYRRRGFGRATLKHAIEKALDQYCYKILLVASSTNAPAAALYHSVGFRPDRTGF